MNTILFTIGSDSFVELMGDISIPRNNALLMGELYANYTFGEGQVEGTLSSDLKVPHDSGKYIKLSSGDIAFSFDSSGYAVATDSENGPSGQLFDFIDMSGSFDVSGQYGSGLSSAKISGNLCYELNGNSYYPESFTAEGGWAATWLGDFGYNVNWDTLLNSEYSLNFDEQGFSGSIGARIIATTTMYIDWPNLPLFGGNSDLPIEYSVGVDAGVLIYKKSNDQIWLEGDGTFSYNDETKSAPIYLYLGSL